jgi:uncharacterized protein involved in exopolysaccharide biosynthesis
MTSESGLVELGRLVARRRRLVIAIPILAALLTGIISMLVPATYTATTSFVPEASTQTRLPANVAGLATQLGLSFGSEASKSPKFYAEVLRSRRLMEEVLLSRYTDPTGEHSPGDSTTLLRILRVRGRDSADSLSRGVRKLDGLIVVRVSTPTNIVTLSVDAHYPTLAAAVANRFIAYLNAFNTQARQSQAGEQRRFVEQRVTEGERELRSAEGDLRVFYERNRSWQQSPQLTFEEGRLRRQVEVRQEVYLTLKREYEMARIQEVNDTPVITVIDAAAPPTKKSKPKRLLLVSIALVVGAMLSVFWVAVVDYVGRARSHSA